MTPDSHPSQRKTGAFCGLVQLTGCRVSRRAIHDVAKQSDSLRREVDSLKKLAKAIALHRTTQERVAREEFGLARGFKEIVYRFGDSADTTASEVGKALRK